MDHISSCPGTITPEPKTYKRELAVALLVALAVLVGIWVGLHNEQAGRAVEALVLPIMGFVTMAFGADAFSKQIRNHRREGPME
jgi:hypothetical protein